MSLAILDTFLTKLKNTPEKVEFDDTMATIDALYDFKETAFKNGDQSNLAGQNNGSCKLFFFAKLNELNEAETLACFGKYYREDVLKHPEGNDHLNIRNFMNSGWSGITFSGTALTSIA